MIQDYLIENGKAKLFCRVFGSGDPLILIHGGPGLSHDYLLPHMLELATSYRVVIYDQRGCGRSTCELNEDLILLKTFVEDLDAVRGFQVYGIFEAKFS